MMGWEVKKCVNGQEPSGMVRWSNKSSSRGALHTKQNDPGNSVHLRLETSS